MRNWKELGEVPDSDDESLDSPDLLDSQVNLADQPTTDVQDGHDDVPATGDDVWDIPQSSHERRLELPIPIPSAVPSTPTRAPTRPPEVESDDEIDLVCDFAPAPDTPDEISLPEKPQAATEQQETAQPARDEPAVSTTQADLLLSSPLSSLSSLSFSPTPPPMSPVRETRSLETTQQQDIDPFGFVLPESPPRFRLGFVRSLRPRKPIQEHPYLLENAQYTKVMKSHGMRPVRVAYNTPAENPRPEEDSQEQEFQDEDTQTGNRSLEESQLDLPSSSLPNHGIDELASSQPSGTRTPSNRLLVSSNRGSANNNTDNTSPPDEDDFPSPSNFMARRHLQRYGRVSKRRTSRESSSVSKRAKSVVSALQEDTPSPKWIPVHIELSPVSLPRSASHSQKQQSPSRVATRSPPPQYQQPIDITDEEDADEPVDFGASASLPREREGDKSDSDVIRRTRKRIRGVLPASWLRLDQQTGKEPSQRPVAAPRRPVAEVDQAPRKGVALPRQHVARPSEVAPMFLFDDSDSDDNDSDNGVEVIGSRPKAAAVNPWPEDSGDEAEDLGHDFHDGNDFDTETVVEDDIIDRMVSGVKRNRSSRDGMQQKRQKTRTHNPFKGVPGQKTRQPKITKMLGRSHSSVSSGSSHRPQKPSSRSHSTSHSTSHRKQSQQSKGSSRRRRAPPTPPMLSILDFAEPTAPNFIRVAARTARSRTNLGKTSPSKKIINLGSRKDNVDALSVLHDWRASRIKPKIPNPPKPARRHERQPALRDVSPNIPRQPVHKTKEATRQYAPAQPILRQSHIGSYSETVSQNKPPSSTQQHHRAVQKPSVRRPLETIMRPAQLEMLVEERPGRADFITKKKALDELYRRRRKEVALLPNVRLERFVDDCASLAGTIDDNIGENLNNEFSLVPQREEQPTPSAPIERPTKRSKFRKRFRPKQVDTTAPRFVHALDPIPVDLGAAVAEASWTDAVDPDTSKLYGLGPFGSQYSQHFDIFPLDTGVFFHRSTLVGSGRLSKATGPNAGDVQTAFPTVVPSFQLDERALRWTTWNDETSSEFGILLDWLADMLLSPNELEATTGLKVTGMVNFVIDFIQNIVAGPASNDESQKAFVLRSQEVMTGFIERLEAASWNADMSPTNERTKLRLAALSGILVAVSSVSGICKNETSLISESFQVEEMLKRISKAIIKPLIHGGLGGVRAAYDELQQPEARERGIRNDNQALVSWIVLMQVLECARLPRAGFWDLTYSVMLEGTAISTCTDAAVLERLWEDMFTLLPLAEFDNSGVVQPGLRQLVPLDGWTFPRQALGRVFQLYRANPHQSPSFNDYCRTLVGRCHYLVQEWGWRNCSGIIGVIFDFYGSQDFTHLRNEEADKSPRFLGDLAGSPSLAIEPEDKCFHIFIKLLALVILKLRRLGLTKEMRNLIARILPNHNRQYLKEMQIHQRDLAALRNHHDLLCTLFWAAPPELRRPVDLIEKLIVPENSHKEACLINIHAWNQLARFVIASGEGYTVYKVFAAWMNNIFQQLMEQYLSAESDMQKQFSSLSKSMMQGITPDFMKATVAQNKAAAMDVLHACVASALDVLNHAKSLDVATYCFSTFPLEHIFRKLDLLSPNADWGILRTAFDSVENYMCRLEKAMDEQYSSSTDAVDPQETEEAVLMLDHKLAKSLFRLCKSVTCKTWDNLSMSKSSLRVSCSERCVVLSARLASRFIHSGVYRLSQFFGSGDYGIFARLPHPPGLIQRKFLPLFVSAILQNNVFDFKDLGTSILEQWLLAITKPEAYLAYEIRLAEILKQHDLPYLKKAFVPTNGARPNYDTNRAFFFCAIASMRVSLREADVSRRQQLRSDFAQALKLVMQQMKEDLKCSQAHHDNEAASAATTEQHRQRTTYVNFVRSIVELVKSHGGDICPVDTFFYQQSQFYSPSVEDPQLQTAGIVGYGLRLADGEAPAAASLFHYLHNNFQIALANNQLDQACKILERSMENAAVVEFMLERMLPAVIRATRMAEEAWPVLDLYCTALQNYWTRSPVPRELGCDGMAAAVALLGETVVWLQSTAKQQQDEGTSLSTTQVHTITQLVSLANVLQPFLATCACMPNLAATTRTHLEKAIRDFFTFASTALARLERGRHRRGPGHEEGPLNILSGLVQQQQAGDEQSRSWSCASTGLRDRTQVDQFCRVIVQHVRENWVVGEGSITVRKAGGRPGGAGGMGSAVHAGYAGNVQQSGQIPYGPWDMADLLGQLQQELGLWRLTAPPAVGVGRRRLFPGRVRHIGGLQRF